MPRVNKALSMTFCISLLRARLRCAQPSLSLHSYFDKENKKFLRIILLKQTIQR